ncbi:unnamed protein product [Amoebophrya sp. A120]|nr:unnamed protein product [Amoebophrya sp. A120]|eukprot:GSA120T00000748001.1
MAPAPAPSSSASSAGPVPSAGTGSGAGLSAAGAMSSSSSSASPAPATLSSNSAKSSDNARSRALELAQYVHDIQKEIEKVSVENKRLRTSLLQNLEHRYARIFRTTDRVAVMAIFAQWKIIASNCSFRKELAEAEQTLREEKQGYAVHIKELEESHEAAQSRNKVLEEELAVLRDERAALGREAETKRQRVEELRRAVDNSTSFISDVKTKLDSYQPSGLVTSAAPPQPEPMQREAEFLKRELHLILQKLDPSHIVPPMNILPSTGGPAAFPGLSSGGGAVPGDHLQGGTLQLVPSISVDRHQSTAQRGSVPRVFTSAQNAVAGGEVMLQHQQNNKGAVEVDATCSSNSSSSSSSTGALGKNSNTVLKLVKTTTTPIGFRSPVNTTTAPCSGLNGGAGGGSGSPTGATAGGAGGPLVPPSGSSAASLMPFGGAGQQQQQQQQHLVAPSVLLNPNRLSTGAATTAGSSSSSSSSGPAAAPPLRSSISRQSTPGGTTGSKSNNKPGTSLLQLQHQNLSGHHQQLLGSTPPDSSKRSASGVHATASSPEDSIASSGGGTTARNPLFATTQQQLHKVNQNVVRAASSSAVHQMQSCSSKNLRNSFQLNPRGGNNKMPSPAGAPVTGGAPPAGSSFANQTGNYIGSSLLQSGGIYLSKHSPTTGGPPPGAAAGAGAVDLMQEPSSSTTVTDHEGCAVTGSSSSSNNGGTGRAAPVDSSGQGTVVNTALSMGSAKDTDNVQENEIFKTGFGTTTTAPGAPPAPSSATKKMFYRSRSPDPLTSALKLNHAGGGAPGGPTSTSSADFQQRSSSTFHPSERKWKRAGLSPTVAPPNGNSMVQPHWSTRGVSGTRVGAGVVVSPLDGGGAGAGVGTALNPHSGLLSTKLPGPNFRFSRPLLPQPSPLHPR